MDKIQTTGSKVPNDQTGSIRGNGATITVTIQRPIYQVNDKLKKLGGFGTIGTFSAVFESRG